jgi:hypothetical protein
MHSRNAGATCGGAQDVGPPRNFRERAMRLHPKCSSFITLAAIALAAGIAACSTTKATGPVNPGNVSKGDSVNLSGSYDLTAFTGETVDSSDGASLALTKTTYKIQSTGLFNCMLGTDSGTYVAVDTASATGVVAGTIVLTSLVDEGQPMQAAFVVSNDTLQVNVPNNGSVQNTVWVK